MLIPLSLGALLPGLPLSLRAPRLSRAEPRGSDPRLEAWHSPAAAAALALATAPLIFLIGAAAWSLLPLGFLCHLALDLLYPPGMKLLWPLRHKHYRVALPPHVAERWLPLGLAVAALALVWAVDFGPATTPVAPAPSYEQVVAHYYSLRGRNRAFARIEGSWQATGRRWGGSFEVLNASGDSFLLLDSYTERVFSAGRTADVDFYLNSISLTVGDAVRVKPAEVHLEGQRLAEALPLLYQMQREPGLLYIFVSGDLVTAAPLPARRCPKPLAQNPGRRAGALHPPLPDRRRANRAGRHPGRNGRPGHLCHLCQPARRPHGHAAAHARGLAVSKRRFLYGGFVLLAGVALLLFASPIVASDLFRQPYSPLWRDVNRALDLLRIDPFPTGGGAPPRWPQWRDPGDAFLYYRDLTLTTTDGLDLSAWYVPALQQDAPSILLCHGLLDSKWTLLRLVPWLHEAGYNVMLIDFRGHGGSAKEPTTIGPAEVRDIQAALDWLEAEGAGAWVGGLGMSLGASALVNAAAQDGRLDALVLDSLFADWGDTDFAQDYRLSPDWLVPGVPSPEDLLPDIHLPVLIVHGTADILTHVDHAHRLYAAANEPKELWINDSGHAWSAWTYPEVYQEMVLGFFDSARRQGAPNKFT